MSQRAATRRLVYKGTETVDTRAHRKSAAQCSNRMCSRCDKLGCHKLFVPLSTSSVLLPQLAFQCAFNGHMKLPGRRIRGEFLRGNAECVVFIHEYLQVQSVCAILAPGPVLASGVNAR